MNVDEFTAFAKQAYNPPKNTFTVITIPRMRYLYLEGKGNPEKQDFPSVVKWFYSVVHETKPAVRKIMGKQFAYPPVEFQFWAKNEKDFVDGVKENWCWRVMLVCGDFVPEDIMIEAISKVETKLGPLPAKPKLNYIDEGQCIQYLHVGDNAGVAKVCQQLYGQYLPENKLKPNGYYHEIYLGDPARINPKKRKIIIRQPVKSI